MADYELKRIIALDEASTIGDSDMLAIDSANGTKKVSGETVKEYMVGDIATLTTTDKSSAVGAINEIDEDVTEIKADLEELIGGDEQQEITGWTHEKYINVGTPNIGDTVDITNISSYWSLKYVIVDCEEGDKFLLNLAGAASARAWVFLTSGNVLISRADASVTLTDVTITAPQNAGKAIFQCIYRQSQDDVTTDSGTVYKIVGGTGKVVRFDIVQNKTEAEKERARANIGISSGSGLSESAKAALLNMFRITAYINNSAQSYFDALQSALYDITPSENISVSFTNAIGRTFYTDDPLDSLKYNLVVTYNNSVVSSYDLIGSFANNDIRVMIDGEYSDIIPVSASVPKYSYMIGNGDTDLTFLNAAIIQTGSPRPILDTSYSSTHRAIGTKEGRLKYGQSNTWYLVPVPADATSVTVNVQPTTFVYAITPWKFNPSENTHDYNGAELAWVSGSQTLSLTVASLRTIGITIKKSNGSTITDNPSSCIVTFS